MATGDIVFFDEALDDAFFTGWAAAADIKCAILDNTTPPTEAFTSPVLGSFTEVTDAGTYTLGGESIGAWDTLSVEATGTLTFDSATNPTWAADGSNDNDAYWGLLYNDTSATDVAFAYIELGGPVNMITGSLTITWSGTGIFTIAKA